MGVTNIYEYYGQYSQIGGYTKDQWDLFLQNGTILDKLSNVTDSFPDFDSVEFLNKTGPSYFIMRWEKSYSIDFKFVAYTIRRL